MTQWKQLTIYVDESAHWHHQPVYTALIEQARRHGLAGATATRAIEGFSKLAAFIPPICWICLLICRLW